MIGGVLALVLTIYESLTAPGGVWWAVRWVWEWERTQWLNSLSFSPNLLPNLFISLIAALVWVHSVATVWSQPNKRRSHRPIHS